MEESLNYYIVLDWGFTRFKLWGLDHNKNIVKEKFIFIKESNKQPEFYVKKNLKFISSEINKFMLETNSNFNNLIILSSCQMHCIAGILNNDDPFLSTWNDLPTNSNYDFIETINGQPTLFSMPINKVFLSNNDFFLKTEISKELYSKEELKIKLFMTPMQLIYKYFLKLNANPSNFFWESSCLSNACISKSESNKKEFKNSFTSIETSNYFNRKIKLKIYPELGDLQASTYSSLIKSDIVINWGTGSQIIFNKEYDISYKNYFRRFPNLGKINVISHIPCGRLFSDYCHYNNLSYFDLLKEFDNVNLNVFKEETKNNHSLLYFPGFDTKEFEYRNQVNITLKQISQYSLTKLICLWLDQYIKIIHNISKVNNDKNSYRIIICGELGGISIKAIPLLKKILHPKYLVELGKDKLPESIMKCAKL